MCYAAEFGCSRSNGASEKWKIPLKNLFHRVPPLKVTQSHRNRQIDRLPNTFYDRFTATIGLSLTLSEINGDLSKSQTYPTQFI